MRDIDGPYLVHCFDVRFCVEYLPKSDRVSVALVSGGPSRSGKPFHYTCPGGSPQAATHSTNSYGFVEYEAHCSTNSLSDYFPVYATFD